MHNYEVVDQALFSHGSQSKPRIIREAILNMIYIIVPALYRLLRARGVTKLNVKVHPELADHPPSWGSSRDHFIVLIQKNE